MAGGDQVSLSSRWYGFTINVISVNANGLRDVPILDDEGHATGKMKAKGQLLSSLAKSTKADVVCWQEGHGFNLSCHPAFFKAHTVSCRLAQAGVTVLNNDLEIIDKFGGENFAMVRLKLK